MAYIVIVKQEAIEDAVEAYEYYETKQPGLGERFLEALTKRYSHLSLHPSHYSFIEEDSLNILRDVRLEKFPYVVVFELTSSEVIVYAIINMRRNPLRKIRER